MDVDEESEEGEEMGEGDDDEEDDEGEDDQGGERKAAAAMCVGVGSYFDPPYLQGLSHFLEHMLFMGTEKYPEEVSRAKWRPGFKATTAGLTQDSNI